MFACENYLDVPGFFVGVVVIAVVVVFVIVDADIVIRNVMISTEKYDKKGKEEKKIVQCVQMTLDMLSNACMFVCSL